MTTQPGAWSSNSFAISRQVALQWPSPIWPLSDQFVHVGESSRVPSLYMWGGKEQSGEGSRLRLLGVWRFGIEAGGLATRVPLDASLVNTSPQVAANFGRQLNHRPAETVAEPELHGEGKALSCMRCRNLLGR